MPPKRRASTSAFQSPSSGAAGVLSANGGEDGPAGDDTARKVARRDPLLSSSTEEGLAALAVTHIGTAALSMESEPFSANSTARSNAAALLEGAMSMHPSGAPATVDAVESGGQAVVSGTDECEDEDGAGTRAGMAESQGMSLTRRRAQEMQALESRVTELQDTISTLQRRLEMSQQARAGDAGTDAKTVHLHARIRELEAQLRERDVARSAKGSRGAKNGRQEDAPASEADTSRLHAQVELLQAALGATSDMINSLQGALRALEHEIFTARPQLATLFPRWMLESMSSNAWAQLPPHVAHALHDGAPTHVAMPSAGSTGPVPPLPLSMDVMRQYGSIPTVTMRDSIVAPISARAFLGDTFGIESVHMGAPAGPVEGGITLRQPPLTTASRSRAPPSGAHSALPGTDIVEPTPYTARDGVPPEVNQLIARAMVDVCCFANEDWKLEVQVPGVMIFSRPADLPVFSIKVSHVCDVPPQAIAETLWRNFTDLEYARRITPDTVQQCTKLQSFGANTAVVYRAEHFTFPAHSRDFVYVAHRLDGAKLEQVRAFSHPTTLPPPTMFDSIADTNDQRVWLGIVRSIQHPGLAADPTVVRADMYEGYIIRSAEGGRCSIVITLGQIDTKHGLAAIPEEHLRATFQAVPGYVHNTVTTAHDLLKRMQTEGAVRATNPTASSITNRLETMPSAAATMTPVPVVPALSDMKLFSDGPPSAARHHSPSMHPQEVN